MRPLVWAITTFSLIFAVACGGSSNHGTGDKEQQNPTPVIQSLLPSTAPAGSADLKVQITGTGFMVTSAVQWAGVAKSCSFVSSSALSCAVTAADLSLPGNANVSVTNPAPGGGTATATFVVGAPGAPSLTSISPASIAPGAASFTVTANGSSFTRNSTVLWNRSARQTTYVSNLQLTAQIDAADVITGGTFPVSVSTPSPGGGTSQPVDAKVQYPLPSISSLSPDGVVMQSPGFTLTVNGANFYPGALVSWNHLTRVTTFVSSTQLTASILSADLNVASATTADVYVTNPSPSAGISNTAHFTLANPVPTISAISPNSGLAGDFTSVQITGTGFVDGATVQAGEESWTAHGGGTSLQVSVRPSRVGQVALTVTNPAPSAGPSNSVEFEAKAVGNPMNPQLVTLGPSGQAVPSKGEGVSGTGRYVSFGSSSGNLVRDTCLGISSGCSPSTIAFSIAFNGNVDISYPSDDGRFVASIALAGMTLTGCCSNFGISDLCTGVPNCTPSYFGVDGSEYGQYFGGLYPISASGRYVPYSIRETISQWGAGIYDSCSNAPPGCSRSKVDSNFGSISEDARYVIYVSQDRLSVALRDTCIGAVPGCVSTTTLLTDPQVQCSKAVISRNAAYVAYTCSDQIRVAKACTQQVPGCSTAPIITIPNKVRTLDDPNGQTQTFWISDSGRYVAYLGGAPSNQTTTTLISDTCIGAPSGCQAQTAFACLNTEGALANDTCILVGMSNDGKYIYYRSPATNLSPGLGGLPSDSTPLSYGYAVANPLQ